MNSHRPDPTRRDFLRNAAAAAAGLAAAGPLRLLAAEAPAATADALKKHIPIGLQLYSVRHACGENGGKNLPNVIQAVAKMGYEGVEFAGYHGYNAKDLRKMLDDNGLKCCGTHTGLGTMEGDQLAKTVEFHQTLGNKFLIAPGLPGKYTKSPETWKEAAKVFNDIAAKLKPLGMYCGYHNHSQEFKAMDGQVPWDIFFSNTVPEVVMQLDFGNSMGGGGDPVAILKKYPGRGLTLHVKEAGGPRDGVIGDGKVQWKEVLTLAQTTAGTQWYIIEHERNPATAVVDAGRCIVALKKLLAAL